MVVRPYEEGWGEWVSGRGDDFKILDLGFRIADSGSGITGIFFQTCRIFRQKSLI
jgi:hypothetical protein